jgi:hypothetical protein
MEKLELRTLTFGEIIRQTFRLYGDVLSTVVILAIVAHVPLLFLTGMMTESTPPDTFAALGLLIVILVLTGIVVNAMTMAFIASTLDRPAGVGQCLRWSMHRSVAAVLLGYMLTNFVSHVGLLVFILPGLLVGGLFAVTVPVIVIEKKDAFAGMGRSIALLRQDWMKGIGVFAFGTFVSELLPLQVLLGLQLWVGQGPFSPVLAAVLASITMPLAMASNLLLYYSLRAMELQEGAANTLRVDLVKLLPTEE